jgi:predicted RNase H-like HicB family nuclease
VFGVKRPAITKHLLNILATRELAEDSVCSVLERTAADGKTYSANYYNLDAVIAVGCAGRSGLALALLHQRGLVAGMKLRLLVELDTETNRWSAVFPELPGCASAGDTEQEAVANAKEALELWFEPSPVKLHKGAKLMQLTVP